MKTFSPAGMANKGFFGGPGWPFGGAPGSRSGQGTGTGPGGGYAFGNATTFGNPSGATRGGGAFNGGANPDGPDQGGGSGGGPWTARTSGTTSGLFAVGYGAGRWIAGGAAAGPGPPATVVTSTDGGATWSLVASGIGGGGGLLSVTYLIFAGGQWVAAGVDASLNLQIYTSPDGVTWTLQLATSNASFNVTTIAFGAGLYLLIPNNGANDGYYTSPDGVTWTLRTNPVANQGWLGVVFDGSRFVGYWDTPGGLVVATSANGLTGWTTQPLNVITTNSFTGVNSNGIVTVGGHYVVWGANEPPPPATSTELDVEVATVLSPWNGAAANTQLNINNFGGSQALAAGPKNGGGNLFLLGSDVDMMSSSPDGITWTAEDPQFGAESVEFIAPGLNGSAQPIFAAVGSNGKISTRL